MLKISKVHDDVRNDHSRLFSCNSAIYFHYSDNDCKEEDKIKMNRVQRHGQCIRHESSWYPRASQVSLVTLNKFLFFSSPSLGFFKWKDWKQVISMTYIILTFFHLNLFSQLVSYRDKLACLATFSVDQIDNRGASKPSHKKLSILTYYGRI